MKKWQKIILIIFISIVLLVSVTFAIDYSRIKKGLKPYYSTTAGAYKCSGYNYVEYYGIGYKIIHSFYNEPYLNTHEDYGYRVGTWFMKYKGEKECTLKPDAQAKFDELYKDHINKNNKK